MMTCSLVSLVSFCRWDFIREGNHTYKDMDRLVAYEKGLKTWAKWVEDNVNPKKTRVFFQGVSPDHLKCVKFKNLWLWVNLWLQELTLSLCELMQWRKGKILWGANGASFWIKVFTSSWDSVTEGVGKHVKACEFAEYYSIVTDEKRWSPICLWIWWKKEHGLQSLVSPWCSWYLEFAFICNSHSKLSFIINFYCKKKSYINQTCLY